MFERFKRGTGADRRGEGRGGVATDDHPSVREGTGAGAGSDQRFGREEGTTPMETRDHGDDRSLKDKTRDAVTPDRTHDREGARDHEREGYRDREGVRDHDRADVRDRDRSHGGGAAAGTAGLTAADARARQKDQFGGFNWGSAFFGWLVAVGMAALLVGLISALGAAVGLTENTTPQDASANADAVGIVGGILLLAAMLIAYYSGGYVAGRMSRFDGARQGLGVWLIGLVVTIVLAVIGAVLGAEYNVLQQISLPAIPVDQGTLTTGGLIALAAILLGTLLAAVAGGRVGQRYHKRVDRAGIVR